MKQQFIILFLVLSGVSAQTIKRVDFEVLQSNLIEINYYISDSERNANYFIEIHASLDGGFDFPIRATSVIGDVGSVQGVGRKSVLWKVLEDLPALVSDNLVIKVTGRRVTTVGGVVSSLVSGNRYTKRMSNGVTFYGGSGQILSYGHTAFQTKADAGTFIPRTDWRGGLKITGIPFIYRLEGSYKSWDLALSEEDARRMDLLAKADISYSGDPMQLSHFGFAFGISYTPLPIFGFLLPQIGGGAGYYIYRIGNMEGDQVATLRNPALYAEVALQLNMIRWLKLNAGIRQSFLAPQANPMESFVEIGLHIPGQ